MTERPKTPADLGAPEPDAFLRELTESAELEPGEAERFSPAQLAAALAEPEVGEMLDRYDLLWFAREELDQLQR